MADERSEGERSGAKWRGRGLGRRNTGFEKKLQYKTKKGNSRLKKEAALLKQANNLCCAARGHALAVFHLLAPQPSLRSGSARSKNSLRPAQRQCFIIAKNLKIRGSLRQSPYARRASFITGRAGPLACAAAADRLRP